jgi:hypothetical protein
MLRLSPLERMVILAIAEACDEAVYKFRMCRLERAERRLVRRLECLALARRCEYEDRLWQAGDPKGTYGQYPPAGLWR